MNEELLNKSPEDIIEMRSPTQDSYNIVTSFHLINQTLNDPEFLFI